jgi:predicted small lipoprotein YifL
VASRTSYGGTAPGNVAKQAARWQAALALLLIALVTLGGCGKKGAPQPPGPPDQVIFPKSYPTH